MFIIGFRHELHELCELHEEHEFQIYSKITL